MHGFIETQAPLPSHRRSRAHLGTLIAVLVVGLFAGAAIGRSTAPPAASKSPGVVPGKKNQALPEIAVRRLVTYRGEIVDYYCYIEKGLRGAGHLECAVRCVSGDVCMGLLTEQGDLYMISVNHLRAMDPLEFKGVPDPFNACRGLISQSVDLTGYTMERKGQRVIEVMDVKPASQSAARK